MATYKNGILGPVSGKLGSAVFSTWKGIPVIRSMPVRKNIVPTEAQSRQRERFKMISRFLNPLKVLLMQTLGESTAGMTWFNKSLSLNMPAVIGDYPGISIEYPKVILGKGRLPLGEPPTISSPEPGKLSLSWNIGDGIDKNLTAGTAFIAAYQEEMNRWIFGLYDIGNGITNCVLTLEPFIGKAVQTYIGFISKARQVKSESRYMGLVNV